MHWIRRRKAERRTIPTRSLEWIKAPGFVAGVDRALQWLSSGKISESG